MPAAPSAWLREIWPSCARNRTVSRIAAATYSIRFQPSASGQGSGDGAVMPEMIRRDQGRSGQSARPIRGGRVGRLVGARFWGWRCSSAGRRRAAFPPARHTSQTPAAFPPPTAEPLASARQRKRRSVGTGPQGTPCPPRLPTPLETVNNSNRQKLAAARAYRASGAWGAAAQRWTGPGVRGRS